MSTDTSTPWVAESIDELVAGAEQRDPLRPADARSGAAFERLVIEGRQRFLKVLSAEGDWIMRVTGNTTNWELKAWRAGLYHRAPASIDHTVVGMARDGDGPQARLAILMDDCGDDLVAPGDAVLPAADHEAFVDHLAEFHATCLGWHDTIGLSTIERRLLFFAPQVIAPELAVDDVPVPIAFADRGWRLLAERAPALAAIVGAIHADPQPLAAALRATPLTFVAGDWKLGNLGRRADGRTIVLDWAYPGEAPGCWELTWYLALNRARLPESKEATIERYRRRLEAHGVDTGGWFERQLGLCLTGMAATIGWEKALGDDDELAWWVDAATAGARLLE